MLLFGLASDISYLAAGVKTLEIDSLHSCWNKESISAVDFHLQVETFLPLVLRSLRKIQSFQ
jgi:hypothetical protein